MTTLFSRSILYLLKTSHYHLTHNIFPLFSSRYHQIRVFLNAYRSNMCITNCKRNIVRRKTHCHQLWRSTICFPYVTLVLVNSGGVNSISQKHWTVLRMCKDTYISTHQRLTRHLFLMLINSSKRQCLDIKCFVSSLSGNKSYHLRESNYLF